MPREARAYCFFDVSLLLEPLGEELLPLDDELGLLELGLLLEPLELGLALEPLELGLLGLVLELELELGLELEGLVLEEPEPDMEPELDGELLEPEDDAEPEGEDGELLLDDAPRDDVPPLPPRSQP